LSSCTGRIRCKVEAEGGRRARASGQRGPTDTASRAQKPVHGRPPPRGMRHDPHRSAGPFTLSLLPAAVLSRRTTASSAATLIRGHPRPWPLSTLATPPPGATIPVPACGSFPLRLLPRRRWMNRQRGDHTRRTPVASTGAVDTDCLPLGHHTPIAAPLQPPTLVPRPPPPSWAPPPPSPLATTANVSVASQAANIAHCPQPTAPECARSVLSWWAAHGVLLRISCRNRLCCGAEHRSRLAHQVALTKT